MLAAPKVQQKLEQVGHGACGSLEALVCTLRGTAAAPVCDSTMSSATQKLPCFLNFQMLEFAIDRCSSFPAAATFQPAARFVFVCLHFTHLQVDIFHQFVGSFPLICSIFS